MTIPDPVVRASIDSKHNIKYTYITFKIKKIIRKYYSGVYIILCINV